MFYNATGQHPPQAWGSFSDFLRRHSVGDDLMAIFNVLAIHGRINPCG